MTDKPPISRAVTQSPSANSTSRQTGLRGHRTINPQKMELRREEIILAFAAILTTRGYEATTLDDVASQLNCSRAVIYYQFRSKEHLYVEMSTTAMTIACERLERIVAENPSPDIQLREAVIDLVRIGFIPLHAATLRTGTPPSVSAESRERIRAVARRYRSTLMDVVRRGMESGHLERRDVRLVTNTIINAAQSIFRWVRPDGAIPPEAFIEEVPAIVLGGVFVTRC
ncbi:MAG: hypothetical protein C0506_10815 [Anaerolinea sp.]|nr:hypothetical protein [Anaerolinea sp.]